jgi:hypothetical protein
LLDKNKNVGHGNPGRSNRCHRRIGDEFGRHQTTGEERPAARWRGG